MSTGFVLKLSSPLPILSGSTRSSPGSETRGATLKVRAPGFDPFLIQEKILVSYQIQRCETSTSASGVHVHIRFIATRDHPRQNIVSRREAAIGHISIMDC